MANLKTVVGALALGVISAGTVAVETVAAGTVVAGANCGGAEWGGFRGPNGSGVAAVSGLPGEFGPGKNLAWKVEISEGYSSPVVAGDRVFLTASKGGTLLTICLDRRTGEEQWRAAAPREAVIDPRIPNSPAAPTPATDGENVYVFFEACGLVSYDGEGNQRWVKEMGPFNSPYGMGASPIVVDDTLLLLCDQDTGSFLLAVEKDTGREKWKTDRPGYTHGYATPVIYTPAEGPREVIVSGSYRITGYALETGEELWFAGGMAWQAKSTPVISGDTLFVLSWMANPTELGVKKITTPWAEAREIHDGDDDGMISKEEAADLGLARIWFLYDLDNDDALSEEEWSFLLARAEASNGLYAIALGGRGDVTDTHVRWRYNRALPNIPSPLLYGGVLYVLKEGGILTALDPETGESIKAGRIEGAEDSYFASPVAADGRIYTASQAGNVAVIEAGREWSVAFVCALEEEIWATPALAQGQIIVRTQKALYCFQEQVS